MNKQREKYKQGTNLESLLSSWQTNTAHIEFTSRCNLRCTFCLVSQPEYQGKDLGFSTIDELIKVLKKRKIKVVSVNGHGETTIYPNWYQYCNKMLDLGIHLHIISNFAKPLSEAEIKTLSRFKDIEISCDTSDPDLFKQLRRGAELDTVLGNIEKIRAAAKKGRRRIPWMSFSCVICDKNVLYLKDYVDFAVNQGILGFSFCNLTKYPDVEGALQINHVTEMPIEFVREAKKSIASTFKYLNDNKIQFQFQQGLVDSIEQNIKNHDSKNEAAPEISRNEPEPKNIEIENQVNKLEDANPDRQRYATAQGSEQTRDCLDPWSFVLIAANRDVLPCCWHEPLYALGSKQSLGDVFNNTAFQEIRWQLLTGNLSSDCANCPARGLISIKKLRRKVIFSLLKRSIIKLIRNKIRKKSTKETLAITYRQGWHGLEENPDASDEKMKSWRWTEKKATCTLDSPSSEAILIVHGGVDKGKYSDQKITFHLNGKVLDEFLPKDAHFYKEYTFKKSNHVDTNGLKLEIETNKTFKPSIIDKSSTDNRELGVQIYSLLWHKA